MGGQIQGHVRSVVHQKHNVVAFCDVDPNQAARSQGRHKLKVNSYTDYRNGPLPF